MEQPAFAMELCRKEATKMAEISKKAIYLALDNIGCYSEEDYHRIQQMEAEVDKYGREALEKTIKDAVSVLKYK